MDPQAGAVDGAGNRNFTNFATSVPELRGNLNATWSLRRSSVNPYLRLMLATVRCREIAIDLPVSLTPFFVIPAKAGILQWWLDSSSSSDL